MENIKPGMLFIAVDGDGIGKLVGRAVIANDADELHAVSARIDAAQDYIDHWCEQVKGVKISGGGDEATMAIPKDSKYAIEDLRSGIEKAFGYTISVGVGRSLAEAGTALLVAKLRGKDRIVWFNKKIKEDIKKAKRRVREKRATPDEYKLSEAYLKKAEIMKKHLHKTHTCELKKSEEGKHDSAAAKEGKAPFQADDEDNRTDDCAYCQDLDAEENADGTAGMHDGCPACAEYDAKNGTTGGIEGCQACADYDAKNGAGADTDDCAACAEYDAEQQGTPAEQPGTPAEQGAEDHHECNCPNCPQKDETGLAVEDQGAEHPDNCPECQELYGDAVEEQPDQTGQGDPNLQGHETAEEVLGLLDQEPGAPGATPAQEAKKIDNTELPQGNAMKENTAVTENFGDAQKTAEAPAAQSGQESGQESGQNGELGQDQPDMAGVLQSGLDEHADDQKKQQVLDMVGQTLAGFKANKASLEATKEQNQALYNSCIQMLKSMIALCDLLGLKPQAAPAPEQAPAQEAAPAQQPPGAAPSEGAAPDPKTQAG